MTQPSRESGNEESLVGTACVYTGDQGNSGYGIICREQFIGREKRVSLITEQEDGTLGVHVNVERARLILYEIGSPNDDTIRGAVRRALRTILEP